MKPLRKPVRRNPIAKDLRTPKYRKRTVEDDTRYQRQPKHRLRDQSQEIRDSDASGA